MKIANTYEMFSDLTYDYYCHIIIVLSLFSSKQNQYWQYILIHKPSIHLHHHYHMKPITRGLRREEENASGSWASEWDDWEKKGENQKQFSQEPKLSSNPDTNAYLQCLPITLSQAFAVSWLWDRLFFFKVSHESVYLTFTTTFWIGIIISTLQTEKKKQKTWDLKKPVL